MSYPQFTLNGDFNICYLYLQQFRTCYNNELYPQTNCRKQGDDFRECVSGEKYNKYMSEAQRQLRKAKVVNVPTYNVAQDQFIFDDGRVVDNCDPIFDKFKWL